MQFAERNPDGFIGVLNGDLHRYVHCVHSEPNLQPFLAPIQVFADELWSS